MKIEKLSQEVVKDLIPLVNSLGTLKKTAAVKYGATNFQYVPLDDMLAEVKKNPNFAFMQPLGMGESGEPYIQCLLIHKSGEVIMSDPYRLVVKQGAKKQEEGAEITYSRRYSMASFFGIASDEDVDGQSEQEYRKGDTKRPAPRKKMSEAMSAKLNESVMAYSGLTSKTTKEIMAEIKAKTGKAPAQMDDADGETVLSYLREASDKYIESLGA